MVVVLVVAEVPQEAAVAEEDNLALIFQYRQIKSGCEDLTAAFVHIVLVPPIY